MMAVNTILLKKDVNNTMKEKTVKEFNEMLSSHSAVPGGGSVSALAGALGAGLGVMVGCLSENKKNNASDGAELTELIGRMRLLQSRLLELIDEDAKGFEPLSKAYSLPKDAPDRAEIMKQCLLKAAKAPMETAKLCCRAIELAESLSKLSSALAISDIGCSAVICKAALQCASLNVYANTRFMADRETAEKMNAEVAEMIKKYVPLADRTFEETENILLKKN